MLDLSLRERGHEAAVRRGVEKFVGAFGGYGQRERMKVGAVLDVLIDVVDDVFGKRRGKDAAVAERAMAEFGAALAPGDDFVALRES